MSDGKTVPRVCAQCGIAFRALARNVAKGYGKFCSLTCKGIASRRHREHLRSQGPREDRLCEHCGQPFRPLVKEIERRGGRFCSQQCHGAHRRGDPSIAGPLDAWLHVQARRIWMDHNGGINPACWCGEPAHIHHRDRNPANNDMENLEPLCKVHHAERHAEKWADVVDREHVRGLFRAGHSRRAIANILNCGAGTVIRILRELDLRRDRIAAIRAAYAKRSERGTQN